VVSWLVYELLVVKEVSKFCMVRMGLRKVNLERHSTP
jgi:hypothetical protein